MMVNPLANRLKIHFTQIILPTYSLTNRAPLNLLWESIECFAIIALETLKFSIRTATSMGFDFFQLPLKFKINEHVARSLGHSSLLHCSVSNEGPTQFFPSCCGTGLSHFLLRALLPPPHEAEQALHSSQLL